MGSETSVKNYNTHETGSSSEESNNMSSDPNLYFRKISLSYFVAEPFEMLTKHARFKQKCLENDNPEAHYIEGLLKYFVAKEKGVGLYHLRRSSMLNYTDGTYLYGLLMLALGNYSKGKKYLDKLQWKKKLSISDHCWERVKKSLSTISSIMEQDYHTNMVNFRPRPKCNLDNMAKVCKHCYYLKRLDQFVQFAISTE